MQIRHTPLSGGYCGEVPPLPIPNREVKLTCADGTALPCGRVGSRQFLKETTRKVVSFFVVPWRGGSLALPWRLRCTLRFGYVALRGGCVSLCFGPLRFVPGGLVPFRVVVLCRAGPLRAVPCSAEHKIGVFVRFLASGPPFSGLSSTKLEFLCQNGRFFRDFWSF